MPFIPKNGQKTVLPVFISDFRFGYRISHGRYSSNALRISSTNNLMPKTENLMNFGHFRFILWPFPVRIKGFPVCNCAYRIPRIRLPIPATIYHLLVAQIGRNWGELQSRPIRKMSFSLQSKVTWFWGHVTTSSKKRLEIWIRRTRCKKPHVSR